GEGAAWEVAQHVMLERVGKVTHRARCGRKNVSNTPDLLGYLRMGAIWPNYSSTEECDDVAPSHNVSQAQESALYPLKQLLCEGLKTIGAVHSERLKWVMSTL